MSYDTTSAEVAEDYKLALEDLTSNLRHEISNLTLIARENTEHAHAISEVLLDHIKKAAPHKKLPALYVLDSIVKNVGTPYTLFFGRKLYQSFMDAYASVDPNVRRKMDEMLKTWKEPVPGSMDNRPVFPPDTVRPIENALIKARTSAMQAQQQISGRPRPGPGQPYRETPTPPGMVRPGSGPPVNFPPQQPFQQANGSSRPGEQPFMPHQPQPFPPAQSAPPQLSGPGIAPPPTANLALGQPPPGGPAPISIESLNSDVANLILATKTEFTQSPNDVSVQNRLKALLELQGVLQLQNLPVDQLLMIKQQISALGVTISRPPLPALVQAVASPVPTPPVSSHHPLTLPVGLTGVPVASSPPPVAARPAPVTIDGLLGQGALAALLGRQSATPQVPTPTPPPPPLAGVAIRSPPPQRVEAHLPPAASATALPPGAADPASLLSRLRQSGLLPPQPPASAPAVIPGLPLPPPPPPGGLPVPFPANLPPAIANMLAAQRAAAAAAGGGLGIRPPLGEVNDTQLNAASLKQPFRPNALSALYDDLGAPCTQCGRRFAGNEEGKKMKMAHMDWHFKVHRRIADAEKRGQHRSWFVDAEDWSRSRETVDVDFVSSAAADAASARVAKAAQEPKLQYIAVPDPSSGINGICPICQEKFENKWLDSAQEWVWLDALLVGHRAYHASCYKEATKDREGTPGFSRATPEPVLGKRKAENDLYSSRGKIKMDGY